MYTDQSNDISQTEDQRYRHLFLHAPICLFVIDLTDAVGTILDANQRAELVYGYPATALVGIPVTQLMPAEEMAVGLEIVKQVQQGQTVTAKTTHQRRDGTCFPVRLIAAPDPGNVKHMMVTVEDITAEKQRRSEAEAIDAERQRIGHEIHDGVAQSLAGLRFKTALWSHQADESSPAMRAALDELLDVLTNAISSLRRAIFALRPLDLETLGFLPTLEKLIEGFGSQNLLAARLEVTGPPTIPLPTIYELPLFRIIQESLNNIVQHAQASSVLVKLDVKANGGVIVSVCDNGRGFDPRQLVPIAQDGHFGLRQMRERIINQGGTLDIHSAIGQGTELHITLPPLSKEGDRAH